MADWTNISTASLEPGAPVRSLDALALRDNPIAIAEGAANAPRVQTAGIANSAVTADKIASNAVTTAKILDSNVTTNKIASGERMTTANVTGAYAGQDAGAVGTLAILEKIGFTTITLGEVVAGSSLRYVRMRIGEGFSNFAGDTHPAGTWRALGSCDVVGGVTLWVRIT
jgi:hypothetical protein